MSNSANKSGEGVMYNSCSNPALAAPPGGKSRNNQVSGATSQGSLGTKQYKSTATKVSGGGYAAMSPKALGVMRADAQGSSKLKQYTTTNTSKGSPKHQMSPTAARMAPSLSSQGGLFESSGGRNMQSSIRTKHSLGATSGTSSGTMNYLRTSGQGNQNIGLSPTAQYKKVLMKGPVHMIGGKVLDD